MKSISPFDDPDALYTLRDLSICDASAAMLFLGVMGAVLLLDTYGSILASMFITVALLIFSNSSNCILGTCFT